MVNLTDVLISSREIWSAAGAGNGEWHSNRESSARYRHSHARGLGCAGWRSCSPQAASERGLSYEPNRRVGGEDDAVSHIGWGRLCGTRCLKKEQRKRILNLIPCSVCLSTFRHPRRLGYFCFSIQGNSKNMLQNYVYVGECVWRHSV